MHSFIKLNQEKDQLPNSNGCNEFSIINIYSTPFE